MLKYPFGNYAGYFHLCVKYSQKKPSYCETSSDGSLGKIQICALGKSFLFFGENPNLRSGEILLAGRLARMLNNRGWMIPVTTLSPKLSLPICNQQHHTLLRTCLSYTSPPRQFLCVTHRLYRISELNYIVYPCSTILGKPK